MSTSAVRNDSTASPGGNRWVILVCAVLVQLAIGSVYAWSVFAKALQSDAAFGWSKSKAAVPFSVVIGMIFVGSYVGGRLQDARGPRVVAMTGGVIYAVGVILASFAQSADSFWLLVLGYGVIGGFGLGMVYIVPIAMLQKWFPDKPGLITGLAVAGFGFGAVVTAPVGQALIDQSPSVPTKAFLWLGIGYLVILLVCTSVFRNPAVLPDVTGATSKDAPRVENGTGPRDFTPSEAMHTKQWYLLTAILTMSVTAGISLIAVAAGTATDVAGYSTAAAAALVGVLGLFNGAGRIFWGWISDMIGKMPAFLGILGIQGICLLLIPHASSTALFAVLAALVYLCYGGAFGTMPSTAGTFFGVKNVGAIYGLMLIGWSIGGVVGPLLIASLIGSEKAYNLGFTVIGVITLVALVLPLVTKKPRHEPAPVEDRHGTGASRR
ncbi:oxalate:formate antiporter [Terrabacter tumescens]|uniref:Oxalate:formate antiporter n=1 Tax=Terrabacter tumescens TaxID=60443 RepID=A0ABQ2HTX0_9MICO|nr:OFA family MFS transporter [Terrabacter tumescens]GGM89853.1 oxalate:formate antiporter [Terrabacter tumescens]